MQELSGDQIRDLRLAAGLSQAELAAGLMSISYLSLLFLAVAVDALVLIPI